MDDRRGDWEHGVDENLASLNAGQRSQDNKLERIEGSIEETDALLHGETDSGLIGRIEDLEAEVARLLAVIFQDAAGKKGLQNDIQILLEGREDRRLGWQNITKIIVACIMAGLVGRFYGDVWTWLNRKSTDPLEQKIERAKRPRRKHRQVVIQEQPDDETTP